MVSRQASERTSTDSEVETDREHDPRPVDEVERAGDEVPVGAPPPEEDDDCDEGREHERGPEPGTARDVFHAATCLSTPRAES